MHYLQPIVIAAILKVRTGAVGTSLSAFSIYPMAFRQANG